MDDREDLLIEQMRYYRAGAPDYLDAGLPWSLAQDELQAAVSSFRPTGDVLELACGPGVWTRHLLSRAESVTAVDASPEMLALAAERVGEERARFLQADLFRWEPDRRYDAVFFGFWLSHVPLDRFERFWSMVDRALRPGGDVFFADDNLREPEELIEGPVSETIQRHLREGTPYRIVKVPHEAQDLQDRLDQLGWRITVTSTCGPYYWGAGQRA